MSDLFFFSYAYFSRYHGNGYAKTELGSSLLLVLEELKKNYNSMKVKIKMGIPLNALPPLSVEINLFPISSSYVPCKVMFYCFLIVIFFFPEN